MAKAPRYYWDACSWIALIKRESGRYESLKYIIEQAMKNEVEIWTSAFTLAEVFKKNCGTDQNGLPQSGDRDFEDYILQDFVHLAQVDVDVGTAARRLLRMFPVIRKPQDGIHAATAILNDADELHTFDGCDLLAMDGKLPKRDGSFLKICKPPPRPNPNAGTLFESGKSDEDESKP